MNAPNWIKKGNRDKSKGKKNKDKAYVSKDDSRSETAALTLDPMKSGHMDKLLGSLSDHLEDRQRSNVA